jgi:cytochrome c
MYLSQHKLGFFVLFLVFATVGFQLPSFAMERYLAHGGPIKSIDLSSDGTTVATASFDYSVVLWDSRTMAVQARLLGHNGPVVVARFDPAGRYLATGGDDFRLLLWPISEGFPTHYQKALQHDGKIADIAFSPDGSLFASASWDGVVRIWSLPELALVAELIGHKGPVHAIQFVSDGRALISAGRDGYIRLWDVVSRSQIRVLLRHGWGVNVFHADEHLDMLAYGGADGTMRIARLSDSDLAITLADGDAPVRALDFLANENRLLFGNARGRLLTADIAKSEILRDAHVLSGPIWAAHHLPYGNRLLFAGLDDEVIALSIEGRIAEVVDDATRRFHPTDEKMGNGARQFARKCSVCHSLIEDDQHRAGPSLAGLFGRRAGSIPGYSYSQALTKSAIVWNAQTINRLFEEGPDIVTPGSKMPMQRMVRDKDRTDLIIYLEAATRATR